MKNLLYLLLSLSFLVSNLCAQTNSDSLQIQNGDTVSVDSIHIDTLQMPAKSNAITDPVEYTSKDSIRFQIPDRLVFIYGDSEILYQDIDLKAETIELDMNKSEVFAYGEEDSVKGLQGKPHFVQGNEVFDAEKIRYNFDSKRGLVYGIITEQSDGFLHSKVTKMQENEEIHIRGGKYTTCDHEHPHFYVHMTKAKLIPDKQIVTGPAYLVIEDVPIPVGIPFGFFPNQKGRASGILIPTLGEEQSKGFFLKNGGVYLGFNDYVDLALRGDIYTLGGWRVHGNSNYAKRYKFSGVFDVEYASLVVNEIPQNETFKVKWDHRQAAKAHPSRTFSARVNYMSAGHNKNNARTHNQYLNNQIGSSIYYSNRTSNNFVNYSAAFTHNQNLRDSTISLTLPNVRISTNNMYPFKKRKSTGKENFINRISVGYSTVAQNKLTNAKMDSAFYSQETLDEFKKSVEHSIPVSTSIKLLKFLTVSPSVQYKERWYFKKDTQYYDHKLPVYGTVDTTFGDVVKDEINEFNRVYDYDASVGVSTKIYGMYNYKSDVIRAVRHVMTPSVSYSYKPDFSEDRYGYVEEYVNGDGEVVEYSPFQSQGYSLYSSNVSSSMRFSLNNNLEMKVRDKTDTIKGTKKISLIRSLSISSAYNFKADSMPWQDITVSAQNTFFKRLTVRYTGNYSPYVAGETNRGVVDDINEYMLDRYGRLWRTLNTRWNLSTSLQLGPVKKPQPTTDSDSNKKKSTTRYPGYEDFSIPWSASVRYNLSMPKTYVYDKNSELVESNGELIQTMSVSGKVTLTQKWKMTYSSGWDFTNEAFTMTRFGLYRDLHCWEMNFSWTPFGSFQRYEFKINVKASVFKDLKYEKRDTYGDVF